MDAVFLFNLLLDGEGFLFHRKKVTSRRRGCFVLTRNYETPEIRQYFFKTNISTILPIEALEEFFSYSNKFLSGRGTLLSIEKHSPGGRPEKRNSCGQKKNNSRNGWSFLS